MIKVKEKFDKCNKEKLLEFCDLLDIPVAKATTRKVCWFCIVDALVVGEILITFWELIFYQKLYFICLSCNFFPKSEPFHYKFQLVNMGLVLLCPCIHA